MFIAGALSFLAPCTLPVLPAYLAFSTQPSRMSTTLRTVAFGCGLALVFLGFGMLAGTFGAFLASYKPIIARISGVLFILLGILILLGRGLPGFTLSKNPEHTLWGSFLFGLIFALSWSGCIGPVLGFALIMAANTQTALGGGVLLLMFTAGLLLPLLLVSAFLDKLPRDGRIWTLLKGKMLKIGKWEVHSTNLISGLMLIILGITFLLGLDRLLAGSPITSSLFNIEDKIAQAFDITLST